MGAVSLPVSGVVYIDANCLIYSIEAHPTFGPPLDDFWRNVEAGAITLVSSQLLIMEVLVAPYRARDMELTQAYEEALAQPGLTLHAVSESILRGAARLRAEISSLKTPDAIHAATAREIGCTAFLTNDSGFRDIPGLPVVLLREAV
jgi:predicted nucleic acid-binding protein